MKKMIIACLVALVGIAILGFATVQPAHADAKDFFGGCQGDVDCSVAQSKTTLNTKVWDIIRTVLLVLGGIAVVVIIIGGIMYATSAGDPSKVKGAKNTILYAVVGLVVAMSASAIITLVNNYFG